MTHKLDSPPSVAVLSQPLEGNAPLLLDDPRWAWVVDAGGVDVFAVEVAGGEAVGTRHYAFSVAPGGALFGFDLPNVGSSLGFLAVGAVGTRVRRLPVAELRAQAADAASADEVVALVEGWVAALAAGTVDGDTPQTEHQLAPHLTAILADGQRARSEKGVVWTELQAGAVLFLGQDGLIAGPDGARLPLAEPAWLQASGAATLAVTSTAEAIGEDDGWRGLAAYHRAVLRAQARRIDARSAAEVDRLARAAEYERTVRQGALTRLVGVLDDAPAAQPAGLAVDSLLAACQLVGRSLGVAVRAPTRQDAEGKRDPLAEIARSSRLRVRRVALAGAWWRGGGGPLLAFAEGGQRPVALLPGARGAYDLVDPADGTRIRVDREVASGLAADAWSFYRPFPDRPLGARDILRFGVRGCRADLTRVVLMGLATGLLATLPPIATGVLFGTLVPRSEEARLLQLAAVLVLSAVAIALFQVTRSVAITRIEARIDASVQPALWDRILRLPTRFFRDYSAGNLASRAMGIDTARQILTGTAISSLLGVVFSLFSYALLFVYSVRLALLATLLTLVALVVTVVSTLLQLRSQRRQTAIQSAISGMVLQFLTGIAKLRVAGAEARAYAVWADLFARQKQQDVRTRSTANAFGVFGTTWPVVATLVIFAFVARSGPDTISTADLLAFLVAFAQFLTATLLTGSALASVLQCVPLYEQARPILQALPEVDADRADPGVVTGAIEIGHVSFRYQTDGPQILRDVSLSIAPGEFVALVGPSGAGKSSLFRLLLGFDTPESGSIYFDGRDLSGLDTEAVRRQMGVVTQDSKVLPGSIYANIVGTSLLTMDDAWEAARLAGLDEDIRQMPMGMQTIVSEGGATFSGGQLQRLMIARAIVRKPRVLLFDEATSALDNRTQAIVSRSLERLQATRIVIAHRLSTIENADRIHVFEAGQIVQSGNYRDLLDAPGPFAELAKRQLA